MEIYRVIDIRQLLTLVVIKCYYLLIYMSIILEPYCYL